MTPRNGQPPDPPGGPDAGGKAPRRPPNPVHAHDEFEIDIDVESDLTAVASVRPGMSSLFDDEEGEEPTQEISAAVLQEATAAAANLGLELPVRSDDAVLPLYMPAQGTRPRTQVPPAPPPAPPPARVAQAPRPGPPDLSLLDDLSDSDTAGLDSGPPDPVDLFGDVSEISGDPPIHDLSLPPSKRSDHGLDILSPPSPQSSPGDSKPRFSRGLTGGMRPLDIAQFETPDPGGSRKKTTNASLVRSGPVPMAGSKRMVRRAYQFGLRELLLLVLIVLLGVGLWVAWTIYQDYRKQADWQRFDQSRSQLEQTRAEAIERTKPKKPKDVP